MAGDFTTEHCFVDAATFSMGHFAENRSRKPFGARLNAAGAVVLTKNETRRIMHIVPPSPSRLAFKQFTY